MLGLRRAARLRWPGLAPQRALQQQQQRLHKTVLHDFHVERAARMVEFAGYSMPLLYGKEGLSASHKHVRAACGLFDVSHMLQTRVYGRDRVALVESLTVADVAGLAEGTGCLTVFTNAQGGVEDDLIVTNAGEHLYVVSNAGCRAKDLALLRAAEARLIAAGGDAVVEERGADALLALQGPAAAAVLQSLVSHPLAGLAFMGSAEMAVEGVGQCRVTRCGYTGEDGFEIAVPADKATALASALLNTPPTRLAGLAPRDSLRLEAGLCLYGAELGPARSPVEAGLAWTVARARRGRADFPGAELILSQLKNKPAVRRVGLVSDGPPLRPRAAVVGEGGQALGTVTSGCPSPSLGRNIAMAYVPLSHAKPGTQVQVQVRGRAVPATVTRMPFVPANYYQLPN